MGLKKVTVRELLYIGMVNAIYRLEMKAHPQIFNKYFLQKIIQPSTWPIVFSFQLCFESYSTLFIVTILFICLSG